MWADLSAACRKARSTVRSWPQRPWPAPLGHRQTDGIGAMGKPTMNSNNIDIIVQRALQQQGRETGGGGGGLGGGDHTVNATGDNVTAAVCRADQCSAPGAGGGGGGAGAGKGGGLPGIYAPQSLFGGDADPGIDITS